MVGLGELGPPTSPLSVMRSLVSECHSFAISDAVRLDNPRLMLWRGLQQYRRLKRAASVGWSWDSGRKTTIPGGILMAQ
jgi:hypothetical protein